MNRKGLLHWYLVILPSNLALHEHEAYFAIVKGAYRPGRDGAGWSEMLLVGVCHDLA
jgi:hypothetical protein